MMIGKLVKNVAIARLATMYGIERKGLDDDKLNHPKIRDPSKPLDRVRMIFDRDYNGTLTPELNSIYMTGFTGMFVGGIYGGLIHAYTANYNFRECNEATLYDSNLAAKRLLQNATTVGFSKGCFQWGFKCGIFCLMFTGASTIFSAYRGKSSVVDFSAAGLLTGAVFKFSLGLKGMVSGAFFGTVIGTLGGAVILSMLKLTGLTLKDFQKNQLVYTKLKDEAIHGSFKVQLKAEDPLLEVYPTAKSPEDYTLNSLDTILPSKFGSSESDKK